MITRRRIPAPILILSCILQNGDRGTTGSELEKKTKLTRKTIVTNRDNLKSNGLIDYRRNGHRATYFPGQRLVKDYQIHNDTFKSLLLGKLRSNEIGISSPFYNSNFGKYLENKNERRLFEFCMRLGISIVYILIQCVKTLDTRKLKLNESLTEYVGQINQILTERWLSLVISPRDILIIFRQHLQHLGCRFPSNKSESFRYSYYSLEKDDFTEILRVYKNLFPNAYNKFSGIKLFENVGYLENKGKQHQKNLEHQRCSIGYRENTIQNQIKEFTCMQCGIIRRISISTLLRNKSLIRELNKIKPPTTNCKVHRWKLSKNDIPFAFFTCVLCGKGAKLQTESEEKLDYIKDLVEQDPRLKNLKEDVNLCREIERFFHLNANKEVKINDYLAAWKKRYGSNRNMEIQKEFINRVLIICEILSRNKFIEPITEMAKDLKERSYIRNEPVRIG